MVVGAFPAAKLGVLAFKQLSKPVANLIKDRAKSSPFFRRYVCMPPAQFYNWVEVTTKMWALNLGKPINVPQLNEAMAIELGANLLGEVIIFTIGAGLLIFEYVRQTNKEAKKEELTLQEKAELVNTLRDLALQLERQDAQIREINRVVAELDSRRWLNKLPFLKDTPDGPKNQPTVVVVESSTDDEQLLQSSNPTPRPALIANVSGNYDVPNGGFLFKALNLIEREIFYSDRVYRPVQGYGVVQSALAYLHYGPIQHEAQSSLSVDCQ